VTSGDTGRVGYATTLKNREFRGLTIAQVISECGDQVARIALAVLVFNDLHSAFFTALTYAVSYLPAVIGGTLLSPLADWLPRRQLMLVCLAARAVLVALIALPGVPLAVAFLLLALVSLFEAPFVAARGAIIPDLLEDGPTYAAAVSLSRALHQIDQAIGFVVGGLVLAFVHPRGALLIDAIGFAIAFIVMLVTLSPRPAATRDRRGGLLGDLSVGMSAIFRHPARRALALLVWLFGLCFILPEGVAVTYAHIRGGGSISAGILTAAPAAGVFIGAVVLTRYVPPRRQAEWMRVMAVASCLLLAVTAAKPPIAVTAVLWMGCGVLTSYWIPAVATFNVSVESELRGRVLGIAGAGLALTQGIGLAVGGLLASAIGPTAAVGWFAVAGLVGLAFLNAWWPRRDLARLADQAFGPLPSPDVELATATLDPVEVGLDELGLGAGSD
jgi:MFS family permease